MDFEINATAELTLAGEIFKTPYPLHSGFTYLQRFVHKESAVNHFGGNVPNFQRTFQQALRSLSKLPVRRSFQQTFS